MLGPTGSGKTRLAIEVGKGFHGEVVVADSRQVYRRLDIASNKPSAAQRAEIPFHMIDIVEPDSGFNAAEYVRLARVLIDEVHARRKVAVLEGGTMLYVDALLDGFSLAGVPPQLERRQELETLPLTELSEILRELDPTAEVDLKNAVRVVRAIEVLEAVGPPLARARRRQEPPWAVVRVGLEPRWPDLDRRLQQRALDQLRRGLLAETEAALAAGVGEKSHALSGIGYAEAVAHLRGQVSLEELPELIAASNRRYARRQMKWLRRDRRIRWFPSEPDPAPGILNYLEKEL